MYECKSCETRFDEKIRVVDVDRPCPICRGEGTIQKIELVTCHKCKRELEWEGSPTVWGCELCDNYICADCDPSINSFTEIIKCLDCKKIGGTK